jgi:bifunctional DNase/RNase
MKEMQIDSIRVSLMNYQHVVILKERQTDRYLPIWIGPAEADAISMKLQNVDVARPMTHDLLKNTFSALESISGTNISRVVVNDLRSDTFYAQIVFEFNDGPPVVELQAQAGGNRARDFESESGLTLVWQGHEFKSTIVSRWHDGRKHFMEIDSGEGWIFEVFHDEHNNRWLLTKMKLDSRPSDAIALAVRSHISVFVSDEVMQQAAITPEPDMEGSGQAPAPPETPGPEAPDAFRDFLEGLDLTGLQ